MSTRIRELVSGRAPCAAIVCFALLGAGCHTASKPTQTAPDVDREKSSGPPIWLMDPSQGLAPEERGKYLAAVGVCAYRSNFGHTMLSAKAQARSELAQVAGAHVESVFRDLVQERAVFTDPGSSRSEQLTKSLTHVSAKGHLRHSRVEEYHRDEKAKQLYVLIRISRQDLARAIAGSAKQTLDSLPSAEKGSALKGDSDEIVKAFADAIADSGP